MKEIKLRNGTLKRTSSGSGYAQYRWSRWDGIVEIWTKFEIRRSGDWEVAIWCNEMGDYVLSTGRTPEGCFRTRKQALEELVDYLNRNPNPVPV